eukprot:5423523-Prymnesium_polylepis.1
MHDPERAKVQLAKLPLQIGHGALWTVRTLRHNSQSTTENREAETRVVRPTRVGGIVPMQSIIKR